jgi:LmbE family N-acetylglucosaminyl deacetylase
MNWQADSNRTWAESLVRDSPSPLRIAVLAAHPDDETIGASVLLARSQGASVIFLSDGAPRDSRLWPKTVQGSREQYASIRREEAQNALRHAGISQGQITWLGAIDQETIFAVSELATRLIEALREIRPHVIVTHPYEGGHPDHDCAALIASIAVPRLGTGTRMLEMTSYHARDSKLVTGEFLGGNAAPEIVVELSAKETARKRKMFEDYATQQEVLKAFRMDCERFRAAPNYDFRQPPHEGRLWYECLGWKMTGEHWRELAAAALEREFTCL